MCDYTTTARTAHYRSNAQIMSNRKGLSGFAKGRGYTGAIPLILFLLLLMTGCNAYHMAWATRHKEKICGICTANTSTIEKDSTLVEPGPSIPGQNVLLRYLLHCDSTNQVVMDEVLSKNGSIDSLYSILSNNELLVSLYLDSIKTLQKTRFKTIFRDRDIINPVNEQMKIQISNQEEKIQMMQSDNSALKNKVSGWRTWAIRGGIISVLLLAILGYIFFRK